MEGDRGTRVSAVSKWIAGTWLGWVLGLALIIVLALAGETVGAGGTQVIVGLGMGLGVGIMQARRVASSLRQGRAWCASCALGLSLPFLAMDLGAHSGLRVPMSYALPLAVSAGGLIAGVWQARILRARFPSSLAWVAASTVGWSLAGGMSGVADALQRSRSMRGIAGAATYLGIVTCGGLVLGVVTSAAGPRRGRTTPEQGPSASTQA